MSLSTQNSVIMGVGINPATQPDALDPIIADLIGPENAGKMKFTAEQQKQILTVLSEPVEEVPEHSSALGTLLGKIPMVGKLLGKGLDEEQAIANSAVSTARNAYDRLSSSETITFTPEQLTAITGLSKSAEGRFDLAGGKPSGIVKAVIQGQHDDYSDARSAGVTPPQGGYKKPAVNYLYERDSNGERLLDANGHAIFKPGALEKVMPGSNKVADAILSQITPYSGDQTPEKIAAAQKRAITQTWEKEAMGMAQKSGLKGEQAAGFAQYVGKVAGEKYSDPSFRKLSFGEQGKEIQRAAMDSYMMRSVGVSDMSDLSREYYTKRLDSENPSISNDLAFNAMAMKTEYGIQAFEQKNAANVATAQKEVFDKVQSDMAGYKATLAMANVDDHQHGKLTPKPISDGKTTDQSNIR